MADQRQIDDLSDMLQMRNSEHREYPFGHPKYRPPAGSILPTSGQGVRVTVEFDSEREAERFHRLFSGLGVDAKHRTMKHLEEIGLREEF